MDKHKSFHDSQGNMIAYQTKEGLAFAVILENHNGRMDRIESNIQDIRNMQLKQDKINDENHKKSEVIINMAHEAIKSTADAAKAAVIAQEAATKAKGAIDKIWLAILLPVAASVIAWFVSQWLLITPKQDAMINALQAKIEQDKQNQAELVIFLKSYKQSLDGK